MSAACCVQITAVAPYWRVPVLFLSLMYQMLCWIHWKTFIPSSRSLLWILSCSQKFQVMRAPVMVTVPSFCLIMKLEMLLSVLLIRLSLGVCSRGHTQTVLFPSCRLVTMKVLNSIVLLGKSCVYVKRAKMEEKLFERPPTAPSASAKSPSRADVARCPKASGKAPSSHLVPVRNCQTSKSWRKPSAPLTWLRCLTYNQPHMTPLSFK